MSIITNVTNDYNLGKGCRNCTTRKKIDSRKIICNGTRWIFIRWGKF